MLFIWLKALPATMSVLWFMVLYSTLPWLKFSAEITGLLAFFGGALFIYFYTKIYTEKPPIHALWLVFTGEYHLHTTDQRIQGVIDDFRRKMQAYYKR